MNKKYYLSDVASDLKLLRRSIIGACMLGLLLMISSGRQCYSIGISDETVFFSGVVLMLSSAVHLSYIRKLSKSVALMEALNKES